MPSENSSISTRIISILVVVATILLIIYMVITALVYHNREMAKLQDRLSVSSEQLQTSIAAALWNFDTTQLDKVLDGGMKDKTLSGIIVKAGDKSYFRSRDELWESVASQPSTVQSGIIAHKQEVIYSGQRLGTIEVFATTRFHYKEILSSIYYLGGSIMLLDLFLVVTLYWAFNRIVLKPLKKLETYAVSVSNSEQHGDMLVNLSFSGEMEVLRSSLAKMVTMLEERFKDLQLEVRRFRESEERFRILVNTIPDLIWLKDVNGVYLSCNTLFERFFGAKESDIVGKTDYEFVSKDMADFFREHDRKAMESGKSSSNEEWIVFADNGQRALLYTTKNPMFDEDGKLIGILGVGHDLSDIKRSEEERITLESQLQQAQKIESVGRLAGGVAHDFNNMLGVIIGHVELAIMDTESSHPLRAHLEEIKIAAERSANLTRQLLAFARKQTIAPKVLDLNETVAGMLKMLQRLIGEDIELSWHPSPGLWPVKVDPSQIDQILANLCVNARDSIADIGKIIITTNNRVVDEINCFHNLDSLPGDYVTLTVSDSGCGMDRDTVAKIFEPFFTTKETGKGTGLGLATVYGAVKQNCGFVNVYSEPGMGSEFTIYIPRFHGETGQVADEGKAKPLQCGQEKILLVEDEPAILNMTSLFLAGQGYSVLKTSSPDEAVRLASENCNEIHLLIVDVVMPEMNGRDLAKCLQSQNPGLKCLFMSGYTAEVIAHHGVLDNGLHFIQKPFSLSDLADKVREVLDG